MVLFWLLMLLNVVSGRKVFHNSTIVDQISDQALTPNLYFVGISKCGTTSLSRILNKHPLVVGVGNEDGGVFGESHIYDRGGGVDSAIKLQAERLRNQLRRKSEAEINNITQNGIIIHYTPHYAGVDAMENTIIKSVKKAGVSTKNVKYLFMIRSPASRAVSSWWYKSRCYKIKCPRSPRLQPHIDEGFAKAAKLDNCYEQLGHNVSDLVLEVRKGAHHMSLDVKKLLDECPIDMLTTESGGNSMYSAHIGKSLYAHQLMHWFASISKKQIYIMVLDNFVADPLRELQLLFNWLRLPLYGEYGYENEKKLMEIATEKHNVHPIPDELQRKEVNPKLASLTAAFEPSVKNLCMLLSDTWEGKYAPDACTGEWKGIVNMMKAQHEEKYSTMEPPTIKVKVTSGAGSGPADKSIIATAANTQAEGGRGAGFVRVGKGKLNGKGKEIRSAPRTGQMKAGRL